MSRTTRAATFVSIITAAVLAVLAIIAVTELSAQTGAVGRSTQTIGLTSEGGLIGPASEPGDPQASTAQVLGAVHGVAVLAGSMYLRHAVAGVPPVGGVQTGLGGGLRRRSGFAGPVTMSVVALAVACALGGGAIEYRRRRGIS